MASSTLDPANLPEPDRQQTKGSGTGARGPGSISDTGSDVQSGVRWTSETDIGLNTGTNEDPDSAPRDSSTGPAIGDAGLNSDTDATGSGERSTAGQDSDIEAGSDIDVDRIDYLNPEDDPDRIDADTLLPPTQREQRPRHGR